MDDETKSLQIKVDLTGQHKTWFEEIQKKHAFPSYAETIRYMTLITWEADQTDAVKLFEINETQLQLMRRYIERTDVKEKYHIYSVREFVQKAVSLLLDNLEGQRKSILHWDIKSKLGGEQREIALAFAECQQENPTSDVTVAQIAKKLNRRNFEKIENQLDEWVYQFLLDREIFNGTKTYHANL